MNTPVLDIYCLHTLLFLYILFKTPPLTIEVSIFKGILYIALLIRPWSFFCKVYRQHTLWTHLWKTSVSMSSSISSFFLPFGHPGPNSWPEIQCHSGFRCIPWLNLWIMLCCEPSSCISGFWQKDRFRCRLEQHGASLFFQLANNLPHFRCE